MVSLTTYRASDRRVYNGATCSDMAREWAHTDALMKRMKEANPDASCTYFPAEGKYMTFLSHKPITNRF
ncbi:MAG: hypothetical protein SVK08_09315, partial [Halobacteriota archaeon]|nr:hypothetical protein [Halobacteriota archaeon]